MSGTARALLIAGGTAIVVTLLLALHALDAIELPLRDAAMRLLPRRAATASVIVAIDEESLKRIGAWPWPGATIADLIDRVAAAGARGVIVDVLDPEPRDGDARLALSLHRVPSVLVAAMTIPQRMPAKSGGNSRISSPRSNDSVAAACTITPGSGVETGVRTRSPRATAVGPMKTSLFFTRPCSASTALITGTAAGAVRNPGRKTCPTGTGVARIIDAAS